MIKMKRMAAILLTLTMAASLFTGCGEKEKEVQDDVNQVQEDNTSDVQDAADSQRISEETINVTISGRCGQTDCVWNDTIQFAEYESRLGIKFDATTYAPADWASQVSLMFASDELPDMFANAAFTSQEVAEFGKDGYFLDLAEYLDVMPNLQAIFDEYPEYYAACVDEEGHIYALPQLSMNPACGNIGDPTYFRKDWCENLGLEVPETLDDLYNVLKAFKEQDADGDGDPNNEIPFLYRQSNGLEMAMLRSFGIYSNNLQYPLVVDDAGKISLASATDNYKAYLAYMHKLYEEGLMNQDAFVITEDEKIAIQKTGVAGMFSAWTGMPEGTNEEKVKDMFVMLPSFTSEYNEERTVVLGSTVGTEYKWAINAETEYPEELAKFVDYLFTEEGFVSARFGYEGVSFDWKDVAGVQVADYTPYSEKWDGSISYDFHVRAVNALTIADRPTGGSTDVLVKVSDEDLLSTEVIDLAGTNTLREVMIRSGVKQVSTLPALKYTEEESSRRAILYTDITTYLQTAKDEFISGAKDIEKDWDAYVAELSKMKLEELISIEQAAYDRYVSNLK